jgi:hypothetical protein
VSGRFISSDYKISQFVRVEPVAERGHDTSDTKMITD